MTVSCKRPTKSSCRREGSFSSWSFVGILWAVLVLALPTSTDGCGAPPRFETMALKEVPKESYNPGDKVTYHCRPGYRKQFPVLPQTSSCQPNGTWTHLQEACTKKSCPQLGEPLNGQVSGTVQFGSQLTYTCNEGYYLVGPKTLHCDLSGDEVAWDNEPPSCERVLCRPPPDIPNGRFSSSHKDTFEYNDVVTYSCDPPKGGDEYSLIGESKLTCSGPDQWSSDPPVCKVVKCPFPHVENGKLTSGFGTKFYYKARIKLQCNEGYSLEGQSVSVCEANSSWQPELPKCRVVKEPSTATPPVSNHTVPATTSTKPPVSTVSVPAPTSTKPPVSTVSGPTCSVTPPLTTQPDDSGPKESGKLGGGAIAAIVLVPCAIALLAGVIYYYKKRKGIKGSVPLTILEAISNALQVILLVVWMALSVTWVKTVIEVPIFEIYRNTMKFIGKFSSSLRTTEEGTAEYSTCKTNTLE